MSASHCLGPIVPVAFNRSELTQPETSAPVRGLTDITDVQPSSVWAYATSLSFGMTNTPLITQRRFGAE